MSTNARSGYKLSISFAKNTKFLFDWLSALRFGSAKRFGDISKSERKSNTSLVLLV